MKINMKKIGERTYRCKYNQFRLDIHAEIILRQFKNPRRNKGESVE